MTFLGASSSPSPLWFATRGAGVATLVLLTAVVVMGIGTSARWEGRHTPRFLVASVHRNLALFTLLLLAVHIATSVLDPFAGITPTDAVIPFAGAYRTVWLGLGILAAEALFVLLLSSVARRWIGARTWRAIHWLAYASWPLAVVHGLGTGSDPRQPWLVGLTAACTTAVLVALMRRLMAGTWLSLPVRGLAAGIAAASTTAIALWALAGPFQPGWAARAGTPARILASTSAARAVHRGPGGFDDALVGTLIHSPSGQVEISLRDAVDTTLTLAIMPPGPGQTLPTLTVERNGSRLCSVPTRPTASFYAVCGRTRVEISIAGPPPDIVGTLITSGPLG